MADEADIASDFIDNEVSRALGRIRQNPNPKPGPKFCVACEEKMPAARRKMGFAQCVPCTEEAERRQSLFAN